MTQFMNFALQVTGSHVCVEITYSPKNGKNWTQLLCKDIEQEGKDLVTAIPTNT